MSSSNGGQEFDYSVVFQASRDAMLIADAQSGMLVNANPAAIALLGRSLEELRTLHHSAVHSPEDVDGGDEAFVRYRHQAGFSRHILETADGRRIPVEVSASPMRDANGRELIVGIFRDLTERERAEQQLRESEERFRIMADGCPSIMWVTDATGKIQFINQAYCRQIGTTYAQMEGHQWQMILHPDDAEQYLEALQRAIREHAPFHAEVRAKCSSGEWRTFASWGEPRFSADGEFLGHVGISPDITERKRTEERLKESERSYRHQFADNSAVMLLIDPLDGRILDANSAATAFYGYSKEQLQGMLISGINRLTAAEIRQVCDSIGDHEGKLFHFQHRLADGAVREVEASLSRIRFGGRSVVHSIIFDVTERKRAEEALRNSQQRIRILAHALQSTGECVCITDTGGLILYVNDAFVHTYGYGEDELIGQAFATLMSPRTPREVQDEILPSSLAGGWQGEMWQRNQAGRDFLLALSTSPVCDETGKITALVGIGRDITERRGIEDALRSSEAVLRGIADSARDGIVMMDSEGNISHWNPAAESILGYGKEEALGKNLHRLLVPERFLAAHQAAFPKFEISGCGGAVGKTLELPARRKDGGEIVVEVSLSALTLNGEWHAIGIIRDITERKQTEQALRRSEEQFRQLAETIREVFWIVDPVSQRTLYASPAYDQVWGRPREWAYHASWLEAVYPDDREKTLLRMRAGIRNGPVEVEFRIQTADGAVRWVRDRAFPIFDEAGELIRVVGVAEDVTERKQHEAELFRRGKPRTRPTGRRAAFWQT